jgi:hypothetical protein
MDARRLYSVHDAAAEQLTWSVLAFKEDAWAAAISLASAAEGMLRGERSSTRYDVVQHLNETCGDEEARQSKPNAAIQWLRHAGKSGSARVWGADQAALWITGAILEMERVFPDQSLPVAVQEFLRWQDAGLRAGPGIGQDG